MLVPTPPIKRQPVNTDADEHFAEKTRQRSKSLQRTRTRIKADKSLPEGAILGTVITAAGPSWIVSLPPANEMYTCTVSGTVDCPHADTIVAIGDNVWITVDPDRTSSGTIVKVEERRTVLSRKAAGRVQREQVFVANVDQLCIVMAAALPMYNKRLIDRYLIAADKGDLCPIICINKMDLFPDAEDRADIQADFTAYAHLGIPCHFVSVNDGTGLDALRRDLADASTLFSGPSGVGKSSLINCLTRSRQVVGQISDKFLTGKHTTSASILIPLDGGGAIVDSPGIRELALWELGVDELPFYFEEFTPFASQCKYPSCSHTHEPGCAVKAAVENHEIDEERYISYLNILESIKTPDLRL